MTPDELREMCLKYHRMAGEEYGIRSANTSFQPVGALGYKLSKQLAMEAYERGKHDARTESEAGR